MIDIHCHILPGVDDGSKDFVESVNIVKKAVSDGVTDIILTPHYITGTKYDAGNKEKKATFKKLQAIVRDCAIPVNLFLGNEIYIDTKLPEMLGTFYKKRSSRKNSSEILSLCDGKYVLVELPVQNEDLSAPDTLFKLISNGWVPIIAHPERYAYIQNNIQYASELTKMGCILQGDYLAILGKYGKREEKTLRSLLKENLIFCLASDIHHEREEYNLVKAKRKLKKIIKNESLIEDLFINNPKKIINGD